MVLGTSVPGRVGRRRISNATSGAFGPRSSAFWNWITGYFAIQVTPRRVAGRPVGSTPMAPPGGRSGGPRRDGGDRGRQGPPDRRRRGPDVAGPAKWGGVARRGAGRLEREELEDRPERSERTAERTTRPRRPEVERSNRLREEAAEAVSRGQTTRRSERAPRAMDRPPLPPAPVRLPDADVLLRRVLGDKAGGRAVGRLDEAARAFTDERFSDARRILNQLVERAPQVPEVLELLGLVHYRMGN